MYKSFEAQEGGGSNPLEPPSAYGPDRHNYNNREVDRRSWKFPQFAQCFYEKIGQFCVKLLDLRSKAMC